MALPLWSKSAKQHLSSDPDVDDVRYDNEISPPITGGARGYLLKDAQREELLECIRKVHGGETCIRHRWWQSWRPA